MTSPTLAYASPPPSPRYVRLAVGAASVAIASIAMFALQIILWNVFHLQFDLYPAAYLAADVTCKLLVLAAVVLFATVPTKPPRREAALYVALILFNIIFRGAIVVARWLLHSDWSSLPAWLLAGAYLFSEWLVPFILLVAAIVFLYRIERKLAAFLLLAYFLGFAGRICAYGLALFVPIVGGCFEYSTSLFPALYWLTLAVYAFVRAAALRRTVIPE